MALFPFKQYFNLDFFSKTPASVLGVDIGSSAIKVVQLKQQRGTAVLETYGEISLGPYASVDIGQATKLPTDKVGEALLDVLREANTTTNSAGVSIPFMSSLLTTVTMPSVDDKQLAKMIPIEARKYIPVPISEVSLDWFVIPKEEKKALEEDEEEELRKQKAEVLLVAIHNNVLREYQEIAVRGQLKVSFYELEIFSSIRAALGQTIKPTVVLDMGAATTKLYVVEYGIVKSSHLINRGAQDITQAISKSSGVSVVRAEELKREHGLLVEEGADSSTKEAGFLVLDHIFGEANRVLLSYQKRHGSSVEKIVLTGGGAVLKGLLPIAQESLQTTAELADPFSKIETPAFLEDVLREVGPEFSVAVGLAIRKLQEYG